MVYLAYKCRFADREAPFFAALERDFGSVRFAAAPLQGDAPPGLWLCRISERRPPQPPDSVTSD